MWDTSDHKVRIRHLGHSELSFGHFQHYAEMSWQFWPTMLVPKCFGSGLSWVQSVWFPLHLHPTCTWSWFLTPHLLRENTLEGKKIGLCGCCSWRTNRIKLCNVSNVFEHRRPDRSLVYRSVLRIDVIESARSLVNLVLNNCGPSKWPKLP